MTITRERLRALNKVVSDLYAAEAGARLDAERTEVYVPDGMCRHIWNRHMAGLRDARAAAWAERVSALRAKAKALGFEEGES